MTCIYSQVNQVPYNKSTPFTYPDAHNDISNSKYSKETTGNVINKIYTSTREEIQQHFPTESQYPYPPLIITVDPNHRRHNNGIAEYQLAHGMLVYNNDPACTEPFAVRNLNSAGSLQAGYAKNIDLDSELKRINHIADKCYYDNFKAHPLEAPVGNGLYCNKSTLVPDYSYIGKPTCLPRQPQLSVLTPIPEQHPIVAQDLYQSDNTVNYGNITYPDNSKCVGKISNASKCIPRSEWQEFPKCSDNLPDNAQCLLSYKMSIAGNIPTHYKFNGDIYHPHPTIGPNFAGCPTTGSSSECQQYEQTNKYSAGYPCQRLFNNSTKRSTLPNFHNTFDINPKLL